MKQLTLFDSIYKREVDIEELFYAYFSCRKNKRNTHNALKFEVDYEYNLFLLKEEIENGTYSPGRSIAFIVNKPVKREIFAADFRDRVVHHWLINKLNPLFENVFIPDSYACRVGKGTHYGVARVNQFIKECSENYTKDCYVLKLDIQGFFMHIHRTILVNSLKKFVYSNYHQPDINLVIELLEKVIFNAAAENCFIKGKKKDWKGLPNNKSLFHSPKNCGLPIGNLTSQVFANFYMHAFDSYVKNELGISYYGRYVDDFVIVHPNKEFLKSLLPKLSNFLSANLKLTLHPNKIYLQHYSKGVKFLGTIIKPNRIYIANRTKGNFYHALHYYNQKIKVKRPTGSEKQAFRSMVNSYLGILKHYQTFRIRKKMVSKISEKWRNYYFPSHDFLKLKSRIKIVKKIRDPIFIHFKNEEAYPDYLDVPFPDNVF